MTPKREKFCLLYAQCGNATKAAIEAGYSPRTAKSQGQRLLTFADVRERIRQLQFEEQRSQIATVADIQQFLTSVTTDDSVSMGHRLRAAELLLKCRGAFLLDSGADIGEQEDVIIYLPEQK